MKCLYQIAQGKVNMKEKVTQNENKRRNKIFYINRVILTTCREQKNNTKFAFKKKKKKAIRVSREY